MVIGAGVDEQFTGPAPQGLLSVSTTVSTQPVYPDIVPVQPGDGTLTVTIPPGPTHWVGPILWVGPGCKGWEFCSRSAAPIPPAGSSR